MSDTKNENRILFSGSFYGIFSAVFISVVSYFVRRYLSFTLSIQEVGEYYALLALVQMISVFSEFGLFQSGVAAFLAPQNDVSDVFNRLLRIRSVCGIAILALLLCLTGPIERNYMHTSPGHSAKLILFAGCSTLFACIEYAYAIYWHARRAYGMLNIFVSCRAVLLFLVTVAATYKFGLIGAMAMQASVALLSLAASILLTGRNMGLWPRFPSGRPAKAEMSRSKLALASVCISVISYSDMVLLTYIRGPEDAGVYSMALSVAQIVLILAIVPPVFLPTFIKMGENMEFRRFRTILLFAISFIVLANVMSAVFLNYCAPRIITILFPRAYLPAAGLLIPLTSAMIFFLGGTFFQHMLLALKREKSILSICAALTVLNLILHCCAIRQWGGYGAAYATMITHFLYMASYAAIILLVLRSLNKKARM